MSVNAFELFAKIGLDSSGVESGLASVLDFCKSGFSKITSLGINAFKNIASSSVQVGMSFDSAMSQVAATMGISTEEMKDQVGSVETAYGHFEGNLRDFAKFLGGNTKYSATEAAEALNYMALAGYKVDESMSMLPTVLNLAAAGGIDLAYASDMVTDTQKALGLSFERTSRMVDEFAKAASTGNTSVSQIGEAMLTLGGLAKEVNGGFITLSDGTVTAIDGVQSLEIAFTALANAGVKGTEAGMHMRNMLLKLASPTSDAQELLDKLGISLYDDAEQMKALDVIFKDLNKGLSSLTQQEKLQAISDLFNARDTASAEALLAAVEQDWDAIGEAIVNADGAAQKMALTQQDNLGGAKVALESAMETLKIELSEVIIPILTEITKIGTKIVQKVTKFLQSDEFQAFKEKFIQIAGNIKDAVVEKATTIYGEVSTRFKAVKDFVVDNWDTIKEKAKTTWATIRLNITNAVAKIKEKVETPFKNIKETVTEALTKIKDALSPVISRLKEWITTGKAGADAGNALGTAVNILVKAVDFLVYMIADVGAKIIEWFDWLTSGSTGADIALSALAGTVTAVVTAFLAVKGIAVIVSVIGAVEGAFVALNAVLLANPILIIIGLIGGLIAAFVVLYKKSEKFRNFVDESCEFIKGVFEEAVNNIINLIDKVVQKVTEAYNAVRGFLSYIGEDDAYYDDNDSPYAPGTPEYEEWIREQYRANKPKTLKKTIREQTPGEISSAADAVGDIISSVTGGLFRKKFARGGIVDRPTNALIGEAGTEAVVPLENNTGWIDKLADRLKGTSGMVVQNLTINMNGMEISDDYGTQRFIDKISERLKVQQNLEIRGVGGTYY